MTDPVEAALWLVVAAFVVLVLCLGGTLIAAGLVRRPAPQATVHATSTGAVTTAPE